MLPKIATSHCQPPSTCISRIQTVEIPRYPHRAPIPFQPALGSCLRETGRQIGPRHWLTLSFILTVHKRHVPSSQVPKYHRVATLRDAILRLLLYRVRSGLTLVLGSRVRTGACSVSGLLDGLRLFFSADFNDQLRERLVPFQTLIPIQLLRDWTPQARKI